MEVDAQHAALLVVDMQHGFCHPEGNLYAPGSEEALEPVGELIESARDHGVEVIFTRDVHPPDQFEGNHYYDEFDRWGPHVKEGSWVAKLHEDLPVEEDDHVVEKHTYDAFYRTELEGYLKARDLKDLIVCGTLANVCVLHTAGSAGLRDFRTILIEDAIGAIEPDHKAYALDHADWLFGEVTTRDDLSFR